MPRLLVMRHAKSSWKDPALADHDRPLNRRGKRDAPRMGAWIAERGLTPDYVLGSSARRVQETWRLASRQLDAQVEQRFSPDLYHGDATELLECLRAAPAEADRVLLIGHNPGLEELVETLGGEEVTLPTAAIALLEFAGPWAALEDASLLSVTIPKLVAP
jgi:phosphohistidine phosphatase